MDTVGQGPTALAVGAGGGCLDIFIYSILSLLFGGGRVGELPVPGRPAIWIIVGQGLTALAVSAGWGCLDIFTLVYLYSSLSLSLSLGDDPI